MLDIKYWVNLVAKEFNIDEEETIKQFDQYAKLDMLKYISNKFGIVAWTVADDFKGRKAVLDLIIYVKPEYRNNPLHLMRMLKILESQGKYHGSLLISSTFAYKSDQLLSLLVKKGYKINTVRKEF